MKIELRRFNFLDYLRFLFLTLNRRSSGELEDNFFTYFVKGMKSFFRKEKDWKFAITAGRKFAGSVGLWYSERKKWELGYFVLDKYRNKGIATKAVKKVLKFAFGNLKLRSVFAVTDVDNGASQKVLRKVGFKIIGENKKDKEILWEKILKI